MHHKIRVVSFQLWLFLTGRTQLMKALMFAVQKPENIAGLSLSPDSESSASGSPASCSKSSQNRVILNDMKEGRRKSSSRRGDDPTIVDSFPERTQAGELFSAAVGGRHLPPVRSFFMLMSIVIASWS